MALYYRNKDSSTAYLLESCAKGCLNFEETIEIILTYWSTVEDELKDVSLDDLESFYEEFVCVRKEWMCEVNRLLYRYFLTKELSNGYIKYKLIEPFKTDLDQFITCKIIELTIQGTSQTMSYYTDSIYIEDLLNKNIYKEMNKELYKEYEDRLSYSYPYISDNLYKELVEK